MKGGGRRRNDETEEGLSDQHALAALRRAVLHDTSERGAVPLRAIRAHLAIAPRSARARALADRLESLRRTGYVKRARMHGVEVWTLTTAGAELLAEIEASGCSVTLPESPQHEAWRTARATAAQELSRFATTLRQDIREAEELLDAIGRGAALAPHSDAWLALGPRLLGDCRRLGSAWHCLHEWPEPVESAADRDPAATDPLRVGRRNILLWTQGA